MSSVKVPIGTASTQSSLYTVLAVVFLGIRRREREDYLRPSAEANERSCNYTPLVYFPRENFIFYLSTSSLTILTCSFRKLRNLQLQSLVAEEHPVWSHTDLIVLCFDATRNKSRKYAAARLPDSMKPVSVRF